MDHPTARDSEDYSHEKTNLQPGKEFLFADLEEGPPSLKPYFFFCMMYCFNAIFILPFFIFLMVFKLFSGLYDNLRRCALLRTIQVLVYYFIDILMAVSVLSMYPLAFFPSPKTSPINYQYWAISCLIFLQSFLLLQSYMMTLNDEMEFETFSHFAKVLISEENQNQLGLGRLAKKMDTTEEHSAEVISQLKHDLLETVNRSMEAENIDETLFYFTLESDVGIVRIEELQDLTKDKIKKLVDRAKSKIIDGNILLDYSRADDDDEDELHTRNQVLRYIRTQGFRGKRHIIDNLLWPHYQYVKMMQHFSNWNMMMIVVFVLLLKLSYPIYAIVVHDTPENRNQHIMLLACFVGMYLNMISILVDLIINEDLKGRRYILSVLQTLIQDKVGKTYIEEDSFYKGEQEDLPQNHSYKLDLSCNLSLESWDNARRLTITFDQRNQDMYETTFSFLAIYWAYTYIILSQDFLGFDLLPALHKFFSSPIQEWNMLMDFLLITLLFLTRVNQGSMYNETFEHLHSSIKKISGVYSDKKSLFDFYFSHSILYNIQNETYKNITHRIYCTASEKTLFQIALRNSVKNVTPAKFRSLVAAKSKERIEQLCATMEKLISQIEFDSEHFCHFFLGWFKSDITKVFSTILIMGYIFFHRRLKKWLKAQEKHGDS